MDPDKVLLEAESLAASGLYGEALEKHLLYHEHALEFEPSHYGVRLSFALSSWHNLGKVYPPAMTAMLETRDRGVEELSKGCVNTDLFHDVVSLNEHLNQSEKSLALLEAISLENVEFAKRVLIFIDILVLEEGKLDLFRRCGGNLESMLERLVEMFEHDRKRAMLPGCPSNELDYLDYARERSSAQSVLIVKSAVSFGDLNLAKRLLERAAEIFDTQELKSFSV